MTPFLSVLKTTNHTEARAKLETARSEAQAMCGAYYDAVAKEKADYERVRLLVGWRVFCR